MDCLKSVRIRSLLYRNLIPVIHDFFALLIEMSLFLKPLQNVFFF